MKWDDKMIAAAVSVASNTSLVLSKFIIGGLTGSITIISEGLHSGIDLLAAIVAFFSVKEVRKPADKEHPFGHGKVENVSGFFEATLILFAAVFIIHEAVGRLIHGGEVDKIGLGILVMAFSTVANIIVSWYLFKVARRTGSLALEADGEHLRTDVYTSIGVMLSLVLIQITGKTLIDPIVAIIIAVFIGFIGLRLTRKASKDLIDSSLSEDEEREIRRVLDGTPEILNYHCLRTRRSGNDRFIDFHAIVPSKMDVSDSHDLASKIEQEIEKLLVGSNITIHIEPCSGNCEDCDNPCPEEKRKAILEEGIPLPGEDELQRQVRDTISNIKGVVEIDELHIHRLDGKWEIHLDLVVPSNLLVEEGHETAENVEARLRSLRRDLGKISIHVEPEGHIDKPAQES